MPPKRNRRARESSESESDMTLNSGIAGRVKERKRAKATDQQATEGARSPSQHSTSRRSPSSPRITRQGATRQGRSRQGTTSQQTSRAPATPVPGRWRRVIDPNLPRNLRPVNKSPGETSDEDAPTREELLTIRASTQNTATDPPGGNEQPQGNSSPLTTSEATPQQTSTALPFEPASQQGNGAGIEGNTTEDLNLFPCTEKIMEPHYPTKEWERKSYVNLDLIESHAYGLENAPLLSNDELETAFDDGILVTTWCNEINIHVTLDAFLDFPKLLRYAEQCGGREIGVVKVIVPDALTKYKSKTVVSKGQLRCQLMKASHEENSVSRHPSIFKIQNMSEIKKDAQRIRRVMDKTNSEVTKARTNAVMDKSGSTATAMEYCMFAQAEKKRREALGCVDLKMGDFKGNLLFESKDRKWLDSRFFVSESAGTVFPLAVEGYGAYSITYHHTGADKVWYIVKPSEFQHIEEFVFNQRWNKAEVGPQCSQFVRHESIYVQPEALAAGVEYTRVVQKPGEMVIVFPFAYHQGFNAGISIAETQIYGDKHWANVFTQNPDWYVPCGQECKGKGLWKPETVSLDFLGTSERLTNEASVEGSGDAYGKELVVLSDGLSALESSASKYTKFGTYREPNAQVTDVDELNEGQLEPISSLFISPGRDDMEV